MATGRSGAGLVEEMTRQFGPAVLKKTMPKGEAYELLDALKQALVETMARVKAIEETGGGIRYAGVWQRQQSYRPNVLVTHAGSLWHCNIEAKGVEPGDGKAWTLAVKAAR